MKFHIIIFWCQMNYADAARIKAVLIHCWFSYCDNIDEADIVIFDTCSVRQKSEDKITGKMNEIPKNKKIRITGCMIQHKLRHSKISKWITWKTITWLMKQWNFIWNICHKKPQIIWLSNKDFKEFYNTKHPSETTQHLFINHSFNPLFHRLQEKHKNLELILRIDDIWFLPLILPKLWYKISSEQIRNEYSQIVPEFHPATAYVPISTWCNQFCSYCIVPYARGLEKNFPIDQIIKECQTHISNWAKEIYLIGQIVNKHPQFVEIIQKVLKLPWLKRLRYTSPYPTFYSKELYQLHQNEEKLCPHIHIPVQSGSNSVLKKMFRWYTVEEYKTFIDQIHQLTRPISITTDIIVGFSDETQENFSQSLELAKYSKFDMIYIGIYSPRPWTYASQKYEDNIPYATKHKRRDRLNNLLIQTSADNNQKEIDQIHEILIDEVHKNKIIWHTNNMKTVEIQSKNPHKKWDFIKTKITSTKGLKLFWKVIL